MESLFLYRKLEDSRMIEKFLSNEKSKTPKVIK